MLEMYGREQLRDMTINELCNQAHDEAVTKGWWDDPREFSELIANLHGEVSEAWENYRRGEFELYHDGDGNPCGLPSELADIFIRLGDFVEALNRGKVRGAHKEFHRIDITGEIMRKMIYNRTRPHRHGGLKA